MLKIIMFSMTPLFVDRSMGGAQKQLKKIATYLGEQGHTVTILCTRRTDANQPFTWPGNVQILPILRFKQPYPEPYFTPAYNIATAIQDVGEHLQSADRYYSHDGGLIFPYVYQDIPTVISLRSVLFPETLQSGFLFQGDRLLLISQYEAEVYAQTAGRFFPGMRERIQVIYNGFDWNQFQPTPPGKIMDIIPVEVLNHPLLLYPHRPDDTKGIQQTIEVLNLLVNQYHLNDIRVLVPRWMDEHLSDGVRAYYDDLRAQIDSYGLGEYFVFHDWIPDDLMPEYYSLGTATLVLGNGVETFGNVPYESMGCGTPAVVARVGPYRDLLPTHLVDMVDFNDNETAAARLADIVRTRRRTSPQMLQYLYQHFALRDMVEAYAETIINARKLPPLAYHFQAINQTTVFRLAPWCYRTEDSIYHDFRAEYNHNADLHQLSTNSFTFAYARKYGIDEETVMNWYREGYLVPHAN